MSNENNFSKVLERSRSVIVSLLNHHFHKLAAHRSRAASTTFADDLFAVLGRIDFVKQRDYITLIDTHVMSEEEATQEIIETIKLSGVCLNNLSQYARNDGIFGSVLMLNMSTSLRAELLEIVEVLRSFNHYWLGPEQSSMDREEIQSFSLHLNSSVNHQGVVTEVV